MRVLIVDDNATNRDIQTPRLASWGMRPAAAVDGPAALAALHRAVDEGDPFSIVIIDMQMPGMDGEALGRAIKANARLDASRMVMLTSFGVKGVAPRFQEIGFAAYATKPIRHQELRGVLSLALVKGEGMATASRLPSSPGTQPVRCGTGSPAARRASCWPKIISPTSRSPWAF